MEYEKDNKITLLFAGGIFAKIVSMALDKKSVSAVSELDNAIPPSPNPLDDETDTDFHESLPREVLKMKDITILKRSDHKNWTSIDNTNQSKVRSPEDNLKVESDKREDYECFSNAQIDGTVTEQTYSNTDEQEIFKDNTVKEKHIGGKQTSESSVQSKQDSIGSVIPVITISTTESDDEILQATKEKGKEDDNVKEKKRKDNCKGETSIDNGSKKIRGSSELKSLQRQSSVDSASEHKMVKYKKPDDGHKFQYSL